MNRNPGQPHFPRSRRAYAALNVLFAAALALVLMALSAWVIRTSLFEQAPTTPAPPAIGSLVEPPPGAPAERLPSLPRPRAGGNSNAPLIFTGSGVDRQNIHARFSMPPITPELVDTPMVIPDIKITAK